jgi:catechol 2,3-dioxygenase-like lactoylglutathione lyase family enzyme
MKLKNILIVVENIELSKAFYRDLFGLEVILDGDDNVILSEGLVLQKKSVWESALDLKVTTENNASVLYFEEEDIDGFTKKLEAYSDSIRYVNRLTKLPWGQKMLRFYDLDGNLIEVRGI